VRGKGADVYATIEPYVKATVKPKRYRYQIQFACFDCRKSFKRPYADDKQERSAWLSRRISGRRPSKPFNLPVYHCPDCNVEATLMGRAFRAPRHEDVDRWRAVAILARAGVTFYSGVGRLPETAAQARQFVKANRKLSEGEKLARRITKSAA
jgi:hypothetical protein